MENAFEQLRQAVLKEVEERLAIRSATLDHRERALDARELAVDERERQLLGHSPWAATPTPCRQREARPVRKASDAECASPFHLPPLQIQPVEAASPPESSAEPPALPQAMQHSSSCSDVAIDASNPGSAKQLRAQFERAARNSSCGAAGGMRSSRGSHPRPMGQTITAGKSSLAPELAAETLKRTPRPSNPPPGAGEGPCPGRISSCGSLSGEAFSGSNSSRRTGDRRPVLGDGSFGRDGALGKDATDAARAFQSCPNLPAAAVGSTELGSAAAARTAAAEVHPDVQMLPQEQGGHSDHQLSASSSPRALPWSLVHSTPSLLKDVPYTTGSTPGQSPRPGGARLQQDGGTVDGSDPGRASQLRAQFERAHASAQSPRGGVFLRTSRSKTTFSQPPPGKKSLADLP